MFDDEKEKSKKGNLYWVLVVSAILISAAVYTYFSLQPKVYRSAGKFAVFYTMKSTNSTDLLTSMDLSKSVAESIKTRNFLEVISSASGVTFNRTDLDSGIGNIVKADLMTNSNIIAVEFDSQNKDDLDRINNVFLAELNSSRIISDRDSTITIKTIDPLYTFNDPFYPEPIKFTLIAFVSVMFLGLLLIYTLIA